MLILLTAAPYLRRLSDFSVSSSFFSVKVLYYDYISTHLVFYIVQKILQKSFDFFQSFSFSLQDM